MDYEYEQVTFWLSQILEPANHGTDEGRGELQSTSESIHILNFSIVDISEQVALSFVS